MKALLVIFGSIVIVCVVLCLGIIVGFKPRKRKRIEDWLKRN